MPCIHPGVDMGFSLLLSLHLSCLDILQGAPSHLGQEGSEPGGVDCGQYSGKEPFQVPSQDPIHERQRGSGCAQALTGLQQELLLLVGNYSSLPNSILAFYS